MEWMKRLPGGLGVDWIELAIRQEAEITAKIQTLGDQLSAAAASLWALEREAVRNARREWSDNEIALALIEPGVVDRLTELAEDPDELDGDREEFRRLSGLLAAAVLDSSKLGEFLAYVSGLDSDVREGIPRSVFKAQEYLDSVAESAAR